MDGLVPEATCPSQGVIGVESMDPSHKVALDPPSIGTNPIPMRIDSQAPVEDVFTGEIPVPSSLSPTYSWAPLFDQHCGPLHGDSKVTDLTRPRSPSFVQEKRVKKEALQLSFVANKTFAKHHAPVKKSS